MNNKNTRRGFTLIELLVVVLIIGVLAAIALPMYQKAVMKSRFAALMPIAKAVSEGNEHYYLNHNVYATDPTQLDVAGQESYSDGTELDLVDEGDYSYVIATRAKVNNKPFPNNYIVYQKHSGKFAGNVHCEALEENAQANEVCTSLGGEYIPGSQTDGFVTYVLSGNVGADKLPSSLTKLANTVCGEDTNCTAHIEGNTVVSESCTGTADNKTCITQTYNDTGTPVDYKRTETTCENTEISWKPVKRCVTDSFNDQDTKTRSQTEECYTDYATWADGVCTPKNANSSSRYYGSATTEGNKYVSGSSSCLQYSDGVCSLSQQTRTEMINGLDAGYKVVRCNGSVNADITCNNGEWVSSGRSDYNEQGKWTALFYCDAYSAANVCTTVDTRGSRWATYAADNTTQTSETTVTQSGNNVTFTTKSKPANTVTNTATCAITNADWDTGTCKPDTAN